MIDERQYGMFCILDIDDFKSINDVYGHITGDLVLKAVAYQLCASFQPNDIVLRLGGDEFAVYAVGITDAKAGLASAEQLFQSIGGLSFTGLPNLKIAISLGGSFFTPEQQKDFEALYHEGDEALYKAKRSGKGHYCIVPERNG